MLVRPDKAKGWLGFQLDEIWSFLQHQVMGLPVPLQHEEQALHPVAGMLVTLHSLSTVAIRCHWKCGMMILISHSLAASCNCASKIRFCTVTWSRGNEPSTVIFRYGLKALQHPTHFGWLPHVSCSEAHRLVILSFFFLFYFFFVKYAFETGMKCRYTKLLTSHPIKTKAITLGILNCIGDIFTQVHLKKYHGPSISLFCTTLSVHRWFMKVLSDYKLLCSHVWKKGITLKCRKTSILYTRC